MKQLQESILSSVDAGARSAAISDSVNSIHKKSCRRLDDYIHTVRMGGVGNNDEKGLPDILGEITYPEDYIMTTEDRQVWVVIAKENAEFICRSMNGFQKKIWKTSFIKIPDWLLKQLNVKKINLK